MITSTASASIPEPSTQASEPQAKGTTVRIAGGSFDFLAGAYAEDRKKLRKRSVALVAGGSILIATVLFTLLQIVNGNNLQNQITEAQTTYSTTQRLYQQQTGEAPLTRSQLQTQLESSEVALAKAATSAVDVPKLVNQIEGILPEGATITELDVQSWTPPKSNEGASSGDSPAEPKVVVTVTVSLTPSQVPVLERSMSALPFWKSQTSSTTRQSSQQATTTVTITADGPLPPDQLAQFTPDGGE